MKKTAKIILALCIVICSLYIGNIHSAHADSFTRIDYTPLTPIPGTVYTTGTSTGKTNLPLYIRGMYMIFISLAAVIAVILIILGGVQYMSTDAISGKREGIDRVKNAIYGLILIIASWVILNTINPDILKLNFSGINNKGTGSVISAFDQEPTAAHIPTIYNLESSNIPANKICFTFGRTDDTSNPLGYRCWDYNSKNDSQNQQNMASCEAEQSTYIKQYKKQGYTINNCVISTINNS